ncbi:hypothetical protein AB0331_15555 [Dietzia maris]|uniref:hypothetical protein n=1 Tax=Dietzia maris TaxID=37915 RepID=UPI0034507F80
MTTSPDPTHLPVWVRAVTTTGALREACADYQLTSTSLLLVCATRRSETFTTAATKYGVARPSGSATEPVQAYAASICDFARQYPNRLLARPGTGMPETVTDPDTGEHITPWADLGPVTLNGR